jgi:predicted RNA-binding protein with PIN domain/predicted small secreted protein
MKNVVKTFGIIALVAVIGFGIASCDNGTTTGSGTDPVTNTAALEAKIAEAEALKTGVTVNEETDPANVTYGVHWVTQAQMTALNNAIGTATTAKTSSTTQTAVNQAVSALQNAMTTFSNAIKTGAKDVTAGEIQALLSEAEEAKDGVVISLDGTDVSATTYWVTQAAMTALENAIAALENASDQNGKNAAYAALLQAVETFEEAKTYGTLIAPDAPLVTDVEIHPETVSVAVGKTQQFAATVTGNNLSEEHKTVTWTITTSPKAADTTISATGLLTVSANETNTTLTIKATSDTTPAESGTATVTVFDPAVALKAKWYISPPDAAALGTAYYNLTDGDKFVKEGSDNGNTFEASGDQITLTTSGQLSYTAKFIIYESMLIIYETTDPTLPIPVLRNGTYFKGGQHTITTGGDPDFNSASRTVFDVSTTREWNAVRDYISFGEANKNYIINIIGTVTVAGNGAYPSQNTFNVDPDGMTPTSAGKISIRGGGTPYAST